MKTVMKTLMKTLINTLIKTLIHRNTYPAKTHIHPNNNSYTRQGQLSKQVNTHATKGNIYELTLS